MLVPRENPTGCWYQVWLVFSQLDGSLNSEDIAYKLQIYFAISAVPLCDLEMTQVVRDVVCLKTNMLKLGLQHK